MINYFIDSDKDFKQKRNLLICKEIEKEIIGKDEEIFKNIKFYNKKYNCEFKISKWRKRKLKVPDGVVVFNRRQYFYKLNGKKHYVFLVDKELGILRYKHFDKNYREEIFGLIKNNNQYSLTALANALPLKTSKSTIHRFLKYRPLNQNYIKHKTLDDNKPLYINIDDTYNYFKVNKHWQKHRIRLFAFHQGKDYLTNKLINQNEVVYVVPKEIKTNANKTCQMIRSILGQLYTNIPKNLIINSDGANEFHQVAEILKAKKSLDTFHISQKLYWSFKPNIKMYCGINKNIRNLWFSKLKNLLSIGAFKKSENTLETIKLWCYKFNKLAMWKSLNSLIKYLRKNKKAILFKKSKLYYPITTEGFIFHRIKKLFLKKTGHFSIRVWQSIANFWSYIPVGHQ